MTTNGFLDRNIQKQGIMPSVQVCIEHYAKLAAAIQEAHVRNKSLAVCWLDLANARACGSVHHDLITFSLRVPNQFVSLVDNLYGRM